MTQRENALVLLVGQVVSSKWTIICPACKNNNNMICALVSLHNSCDKTKDNTVLECDRGRSQEVHVVKTCDPKKAKYLHGILCIAFTRCLSISVALLVNE